MRLFVALRPPSDVREALLQLARGSVDRARWQNDAQLHLTLAFLGDVPEREAEFTDSVQLDEIMTRQVASVDPHAGIKEAALYLQRHKYGCLPVLKGRKLIGIVTESDFIAVAINLLELMEEQEPPTDF